MENGESARRLSALFSAIYFHCHPEFEVELSHSAVRVMQYVALKGPATIHALSGHLGVAHNTASEIVRRLQNKGLVVKRRRRDDERVVEVTLTDDGQNTVLQHTGLDISRLVGALESMSGRECTDIEQGLTKLLHAVGG